MTAADNARAAALTRIVELADAHRLSVEEIAAALAGRRSGESSASARTTALTRLLAYLGGVFVFAGIAVFIATQWNELNSAGRVIVTLGVGVAAFAMAFIGAKDPRFAPAVTPLYLVAAVLQPFGILVAMAEYGAGGDPHYASLLAAGVLLAQQLLVYLATGRTVLLFTSLAFGAIFLITLLDLLGAGDDAVALTTGASLLLLCIGIARTEHAGITPFWYFVATALVLLGAFSLLEGTPFELAFLGGACGLVYLSTVTRSRSVLIVATCGILAYVGYFTAEHFTDAVGWPLALIGFGFAMIALSAAAVTISRRYIARPGAG